MTDVSAHILISGQVQGVGFRDFAARAARRHGLAGRVRNLPDGRVEVDAEGPPDALDRFLADLRRGPAGGQVDDLALVRSAPRGAWSGFRIDPS